jgi:hypothetical protein
MKHTFARGPVLRHCPFLAPFVASHQCIASQHRIPSDRDAQHPKSPAMLAITPEHPLVTVA